MTHVELIAAFTAFTGLVLAWMMIPASVRAAQYAPEAAPAYEQVAA